MSSILSPSTKKEILRQKILKQVQNIPLKQKNEWTKIIVNKVLQNQWIQNYQTIAIYYPTSNEVDTKLLINHLLSQKKRVCLPRLENEMISMHQIHDLTFAFENQQGIKVPLQHLPLCYKKDIDVVIVPGLAFDQHKNRLGKGKGHYDRYFQNFKGKKIMLAFACQEVQNIPAEHWDAKVDVVLTNS